ncbi:unnamed protein product, partial [Meganyctiphanes norvegica]
FLVITRTDRYYQDDGMRALLMISACVGLALARPQYYPTVYNGYNGLGYNAAPYAVASPYAVAANAPVVTYEQNIIPDTVPAPVIPYTPIAVQPAAVPTEYKSQYHSQDELGQFSFGHISGDQAHHQVRDFTGAVQGSYTYINAEGEQVVAHYIADSNGFRVSSNALPVAPTFDGVAPTFDGVAPVNDLVAPVFDLEQVMDTDEVKAATAEHFRLVAEHKAAVEAAILAAAVEAETEAPAEVAPVEEDIVEELPIEAAEAATEAPDAVAEDEITEAAEAVTDAPVEEAAAEKNPAERRKRHIFYTNGAFAAAIPVAAPQPVVYHPEFYSALQPEPVDLTTAEDVVVAPAAVTPVVRDAEVLRIENNPGHAVSYRVY